MTALSLQFMRSFPVLAAPTRGFRSGFRHLSLTEVRVLLVTLAISLCLFVWVPMFSGFKRDEMRTMLQN